MKTTKTETASQNYKGHKIEARLTKDIEQIWAVFIDNVYYSDLAASSDDDAIENAQIKIDQDEFWKNLNRSAI
jgi:hypothetical protein